MLAQLLKSMRAGTSGDEAGNTMLEIAEEHLARVLAAQGCLGLANLVEESLRARKLGSPIR